MWGFYGALVLALLSSREGPQSAAAGARFPVGQDGAVFAGGPFGGLVLRLVAAREFGW